MDPIVIAAILGGLELVCLAWAVYWYHHATAWGRRQSGGNCQCTGTGPHIHTPKYPVSYATTELQSWDQRSLTDNKQVAPEAANRRRS